MASMGLKYIHHSGPDRRGIDVALLYNPRLFTVTDTASYRYVKPDQPDYRTRDQLLVSGRLAGARTRVRACVRARARRRGRCPRVRPALQARARPRRGAPLLGQHHGHGAAAPADAHHLQDP